jgi:hypothetical protein
MSDREREDVVVVDGGRLLDDQELQPVTAKSITYRSQIYDYIPSLEEILRKEIF